jgi:glycosyltransferase involved in cell wall biosynthesis
MKKLFLKKMNSKKLKVSILIVNYNNSKYIPKCINSLLNQNYPNIEIIFLDDVSTDDSLDIAKLYKKKILIVKKKIKKKNIGAFDQIESFKECLKNSTGDIIFLLDSDDYFHKKKVSYFVRLFEKNKVDLICDLPIERYPNYQTKIKLKKKLFKTFWPYQPPTSCIAIRRKIFFETLKKIDFKIYPDIWLDFRIIIAAIYLKLKYLYVDKNLTFYRKLDGSASSKFKYFSINWWRRRSQAHDYVKFFFEKYKINYKKDYDYFITKFVNFFI